MVAHVVADITDDAAARTAVAGLGERLGRIDVLHFNPSAFRQEDPLTLTVDHLLADVRLGVGALLTALQAARPFMSEGGRITATGSMAADQPWHGAPSLGVQKAGLRNLVHSIDATLEPDGIRAVSVTVRGTLSDEGPFTPDRVAEALHAAARQGPGEWRTEIPYTGSMIRSPACLGRPQRLGAAPGARRRAPIDPEKWGSGGGDIEEPRGPRRGSPRAGGGDPRQRLDDPCPLRDL